MRMSGRVVKIMYTLVASVALQIVVMKIIKIYVLSKKQHL